jgi:uncharacterized protein Yka (UPF0111/DUF47 family)
MHDEEELWDAIDRFGRHVDKEIRRIQEHGDEIEDTLKKIREIRKEINRIKESKT